MESFQITVNGEPDKSYERKQRVIKFGNALMGFVEAAGQLAAQKVGELVTPAYLDYVDAQNGSNLRERYFANKREQEVQAVAEQFGLAV